MSVDLEGFDVAIFGSLTTLGSDDQGIDLQTGGSSTVTFASGSSIVSCFSFQDDLDGNAFIIEDGASLQCDTVSGANSIVCDTPCVEVPRDVTVNESTVCVA